MDKEISNEDHLDKEMLVAAMIQKMIDENIDPFHEEYRAEYPDREDHYHILEKFYKSIKVQPT